MRHIVKLRPHRYLQVDSYKRQKRNKIINLLIKVATILLVTCLTAINICAALGIDLTNLNPNSNANTH
jgi:hypothetical protein